MLIELRHRRSLESGTMISKRAYGPGAMSRSIYTAKTLVAALVLSVAGGSAAHACTGTMTIANNMDAELDVYNIYTENKNGSWVYNLSWPFGIYIKANKTKYYALNTTRGPKRSFRLKADTNVGNLYSESGTCSEGWTITAN